MRNTSKIERDDARWAEENGMTEVEKAQIETQERLKPKRQNLENVCRWDLTPSRWCGVTGREAKPLQTPEQLQALRDAAPKPRPSFAEKMEARKAAAK
ncbi:MAG: hypothetical protein ABSF15_24170 [Candidatus Sulfotelmatobacter sp.]